MNNHYNSEDEIEAVVQGFESCTTPAAGFTHLAHVTVAVWYLSRNTVKEAIELMRAGLFRFLDYHQVDPLKYHETLTVFWVRLVRQRMDDEAGGSLLDITNSVIRSTENSKTVFDYYSEERLWSDEARCGWVEPDRKQVS